MIYFILFFDDLYFNGRFFARRPSERDGGCPPYRVRQWQRQHQQEAAIAAAARQVCQKSAYVTGQQSHLRSFFPPSLLPFLFFPFSIEKDQKLQFGESKATTPHYEFHNLMA